MNAQRQYSMDFLKIVATILIVFHHYQQVTGARYSFINFDGGRFYFGLVVEFFFVVSGFFMYGYIEKIQAGLDFKHFYIRRASRLLPLVAIAAVAYELFLYVYQCVYQQSWFDIQISVWGTIISCLGIQEGWASANPCVNNPTWYISVLLLCYLVFYLLTYWAKRLQIKPTYLYVFMIFLGMGITTYGINLPFLNSQAARGYYAFFFGLVFAEVFEKVKDYKKMEIVSSLLLLLICVLIVNKYSIISQGINYIMTFIFYPALIIIFNSLIIKNILKFKWIGLLGKISFDVYIWHNPLFLLMYIFIKVFGVEVNLNSVYTMIAYTVVCFIIGFFSYMLIEKPLNKYISHKINI